jgi:SpoVK/Ycf46/Vps4 family AAA+-type ATPase
LTNIYFVFGKFNLGGLPDFNERIEILKILTNDFILDDDFDFDDISNKTEHFSGADLQSLIYNSHLESIKDNNSLIFQKLNENDNSFLIDNILENLNSQFSHEKKFNHHSNLQKNHSLLFKHLKIVLNNSSPSLSDDDRFNFQDIYNSFLNKKINFKKLKSTLN